MLALLGAVGVLTGLTGSVWLVLAATRATRSGGGSGELTRPVAVLVAGAVLAMAALQAGLLFNDFSLEYVANHHARATPFPFNVATAWAALEGS
ncbi:MAG TPA: heme lyase CcmF/NrfE family subunit, partial [Acidimicrobiia bacterium]|nr:heme lyase CcmF/NrfE family subunit [Acidimicrobiia bacterium]